jgi:phosphoribosylformimino-5-aminoimidazole carboxamide ribotide isomerase
MPIEVGGGLRDQQRVSELFQMGVRYAILGTAAVDNPELVSELSREFPGQVIVGIDARDGKVATRGWLDTSEGGCHRTGSTDGATGSHRRHLHRH